LTPNSLFRILNSPQSEFSSKFFYFENNIHQVDPKKRKMFVERVSSLFWILIGFFFCLHAYKLGLGKLREPGPGFIFFVSGTMLSLLSLLGFIKTFWAKPKENESPIKRWAGLRWEKPIIVLICSFACIYLFRVLGFWLSSFLLIAFLFRFIEPIKWWVTILAAALTCFLAYGLFERWLKVPFPVGFWGI